MIIRVVRMTFQPDRLLDFLRLFEASEVSIRQATGCRHLELWQDTEQPNVYCTYSHWDSVAALDAYRRSALFGQIWPVTKALFMAPPVAFSVQQVNRAEAHLPSPA